MHKRDCFWGLSERRRVDTFCYGPNRCHRVTHFWMLNVLMSGVYSTVLTGMNIKFWIFVFCVIYRTVQESGASDKCPPSPTSQHSSVWGFSTMKQVKSDWRTSPVPAILCFYQWRAQLLSTVDARLVEERWWTCSQERCRPGFNNQEMKKYVQRHWR